MMLGQRSAEWARPVRADSSPFPYVENRAYENLIENLETHNRDIEQLPMVFQWNKRDVPGALKIDLLVQQLNPKGLPSIPAIARSGEGVWETQRAILKATLEMLRQQMKGAAQSA